MVVATSRTIQSEDAAQMMLALFGSPGAAGAAMQSQSAAELLSGTTSLAEALRRAQVAIIKGPTSQVDWSSFRVVTP